MTPPQVIEYMVAMAVEIYGDKKKMPKIYTVSYGAQAGGEEFLKSLAREFHGRTRKVRGLAPPVKEKG